MNPEHKPNRTYYLFDYTSVDTVHNNNNSDYPSHSHLVRWLVLKQCGYF